MQKNARIAVVGATGVVGREVLGGLLDSGVLAENVTALATERSEGEEIEYGDDTLEIERATNDAFRGMSAVLLAIPAEAARTLAQAAQAAGAWVVDVSAAFRSDPSVPLVLPAVNRDVLTRPFSGRIVATPSAITTAVLTALEPLRSAFGGIRRASITALYAASSSGTRGVAELETQTAGLLSGREGEPEVFPHRLGFNVVAQVGEMDGPWSREERALVSEASRIWESPPLLSATVLQIPTFFGHTLTISAEMASTPTEDEVRAALRKSPALKVLDAPAEKVYPMPMLVTADSAIHVGRVRAVPGVPSAFELVAAIDNAARTALNAVEVATVLLDRAAAH